MKIYLAGPITGLNLKQAQFLFESRAAELRELGYTVLYPMFDLSESGIMNTSHSLFARDKWMVTHVDIVYADLTQSTRISIGTMMELAWAHILGKKVVIAMEEDNVHQHPFVEECACFIGPKCCVDSYLKDLISLTL